MDNKDWTTRNIYRFKMWNGTGNVLVGLILTEGDQFTTVGGNVNLVSRLDSVASKDQSSCRHYKIRVEHEFNLKSIPIERPIKGFENISECYGIMTKNKHNP